MLGLKHIFIIFLILIVQSLRFSVGHILPIPSTWILPNDMAYNMLPDGTKRWTSKKVVIEKSIEGAIKIQNKKSRWIYYPNGAASVLTPKGKWKREENGVWKVSDSKGYRTTDVSSVPPPPKHLFSDSDLYSQYGEIQANSLELSQLGNPIVETESVSSTSSLNYDFQASDPQLPTFVTPSGRPTIQSSDVLNTKQMSMDNAANSAPALSLSLLSILILHFFLYLQL